MISLALGEERIEFSIKMEAAEANKRGETIIPTPKWFIVLRVLQIVFALIAVAMSGWWIHGLYYDELGFVIVCVCSNSFS